MPELWINDDLAHKLEKIADDEALSIEDLLKTLIAQHESDKALQDESADELPPPNILLAIGQMADKLNWHSGHSEISDNFDMYLDQVVAKHNNDK